jgi:hypothetical protein
MSNSCVDEGVHAANGVVRVLPYPNGKRIAISTAEVGTTRDDDTFAYVVVTPEQAKHLVSVLNRVISEVEVAQ